MPSYDQFAPYFDAWQGAFGGAYDDLILPRVLGALERRAPQARRLADLGIGTGDLVVALARRGFEVIGVDRSRPMLEVARQKIEAAGLTPAPVLVEQDIRDLRLSPAVDAALCVYTVMNQLTDDGDLDRVLRAVAGALSRDGVFVFELNLAPAYARFWTGDYEVQAGTTRIRRQHRRLPGTGLICADVTIEAADGTVTRDTIVQRPYGDVEVEAALGRTAFALRERETFDPFGSAGEPTKALWVVQRVRA
jgi:SAM-dependent methyltransferase